MIPLKERSWIGFHRDNGKERGLSRRGGDRSTARHWEKEIGHVLFSCTNERDAHLKSSPVTGLEWPRGFQEVKVPRFHDNGTGRW